MRVAPPLFLLLAGLVSGCATEPFVDLGNTVTIQKTPAITKTGSTIFVCHSDKTPWGEVAALAEEQCASHGLKAILMETQRWQCRATSPNRSRFICAAPEMRNADGTYVNPLNHRAVEDWEERTGKKAPAYGSVRSPATDTAPGFGAPPPAPISAAPPLTPADFAGKPVLPAQPFRLEAAPPAPAPAPVDGGFKLPAGSWGDSFQE